MNNLCIYGIISGQIATILLTSASAENTMQISDYTFDEWVRQYHRLLFGIAYWWTGSRADAEELTQEAFYQAYRSRSSLRDVEAAKGWLVGILRHCYAQMNRKGHLRAEVPLDDLAIENEGPDPLDPEILALRRSLERLDDRHRLPVVLFYFQDLSYREISQALDLPIGTVMSRLSRAKRFLHDSLLSPQKSVTMFKVKEK